jgi:hypothetical protein
MCEEFSYLNFGGNGHQNEANKCEDIFQSFVFGECSDDEPAIFNQIE